MIRGTGEVLGCPSVRVSVLVQVVCHDGKAPAGVSQGITQWGKLKVTQPKKSDGCIVALKFL